MTPPPLPARIIGHVPQRAAIARLAERGKLPSALLLSGVPGIGKSLAARELAARLLCENPPGADSGEPYGGCGACRGCVVLGAGNHPDFHRIDCADKDQSRVEAFRELLHALHLKPFCGGKRVVLLDHAESISLAAANALLKSLEEPHTGTHFVLVSSNAAALPPTVVSRCHVWHFDRLREEEIRGVLGARYPEGLAGVPFGELALLADGSLEGIEEIARHAEEFRELERRCELAASGDLRAASDLAADLGRDREALRIKLHLLRLVARRAMFAAQDAPGRLRWSVALTNFISADEYVFHRNLHAGAVLQFVLQQLATGPAPEQVPGRGYLLDHAVF